MQLEEQIVYPAMSPATGDEAVEEGNKEHELARKALQDMIDLSPDEAGLGAAMEATKAGIEHHVGEEEGDIFPKLRADGTILDQIATPFLRTRLELGLPMEAATLAAASTKDELLEAARTAGVHGVSSMTKDELAEALATTMTAVS